MGSAHRWNASRDESVMSPLSMVAICRSAWSLSAAVFDTMQSAGANSLRSRMSASLAVKRAQMLPGIPVTIRQAAAQPGTSIAIL